MFHNEGEAEEGESGGGGDDDDDDDGDDSGTDHFNTDKCGTRLQRCEWQGRPDSNLPDTFQTGHLLFYERFKAYQDYILGKNTHSYINDECIFMCVCVLFCLI